MAKARARIPVYVEGPDGRPLAGASVYVRTDPGGADAVIYSARSGAGVLPNPATTDATGRIAGYVDRGDYVATVTASGMGSWPEAFEASPAAADAIDADWIDDDNTAAGLVAVRQADGSVIWAKAGSAGIADDAVGANQLADDAVGYAHLAASSRNAFLKLLTVADRKVAFGRTIANGLPVGNKDLRATITHGLGAVPVMVQLTGDISSNSGFSRPTAFSVESMSTTQIIALGQNTEGLNNDVQPAVNWLAIA